MKIKAEYFSNSEGNLVVLDDCALAQRKPYINCRFLILLNVGAKHADGEILPGLYKALASFIELLIDAMWSKPEVMFVNQLTR